MWRSTLNDSETGQTDRASPERWRGHREETARGAGEAGMYGRGGGGGGGGSGRVGFGGGGNRRGGGGGGDRSAGSGGRDEAGGTDETNWRERGAGDKTNWRERGAGDKTNWRERGAGGRGSDSGRGRWSLSGLGAGARRGGHSMDRRGERGDGRGERPERDGARSRSTCPQGRRLGYKKLEELCEKEPSVVAISLSSNPTLKELLDESDMSKDLVELLCRVLSKAFESHTDRGALQHLANIIKESGFFRTTLGQYLAGMGSEFNVNRRAQYPQRLKNILVVLFEVLNTFPASSVVPVRLLLTMLTNSINSLKVSKVVIPAEVEEKVENIEVLMKHLEEKTREGTLHSDRDKYALLPTGEEAPQDYRTIPIYPPPEEFQQDQKPFLRPNLTSQRYTSTHVYLDTHFRLLREDFVRPLREGIQQLQHHQMDMGNNDKPLKMRRFDDIYVYFDVQLVAPRCNSSGLAYLVQFDIQPLQFVTWENSKRLLFGSLVCLSCDNFESFLFATVSDRDPKHLKDGLFQVIFTKESRHHLATIEKDAVFLMVETTAYFEAYRHVLEGLQEQKEDNLPFQKYIVECSPDVQPPAYLLEGPSYKLSAIANTKYQRTVQPFNILSTTAWPGKEELGLDESQMEALQLALTKELAIIQGPPGTGKTYVGLKIAQALLTNRDLWSKNVRGQHRNLMGLITEKKKTSPMLVVCYTNHALDQFLEGIHKFLPDGIVRVGSRSDSEDLKKFNLRELMCSPSHKDKIPGHLRGAFYSITEELREKELYIEKQAAELECSLKGILQEIYLQRFISKEHWKSLHQVPIYGSNLIMEWLGFGSTMFLQEETLEVERNAEEKMQVEEDTLIDIAQEADLIQAERFIDESNSAHDGGNKNKNYKDKAVRELKKKMLAMNLEDTEIQAGQSEEGWQFQKAQKKKMKEKIKRELLKRSRMSEQMEKDTFDIWTLTQQDRWKLYRLWVSRYRSYLRRKSIKTEMDYQNIADRLTELKDHESVCILKDAKVIGMTTTGAAKYRKALQQVRPRVIVVEEAAEVLEAHTITTLSRACKHLILIGDHQQLRPSATVYELTKNFNLEVSMFERLVNVGVPFVRLNYQHRMRPDIARLLTPHIYRELENHSSVYEYDSIKGIHENVFFVEHSELEKEIKDGRSHQNVHEAEFVVALCHYFILQDYKPEQITILTTYTGQLHCLRRLMPANVFSGVKVHVVDKYQGEENDIVLLSLVRSNKQGKVGFLNIPNRVCVALSRAKKGLYCIGNSEMLSQVQLWSNILQTLREKNQVGKALTLRCQNHPEQQIEASCAQDFKGAPEGGCMKPCEFRLDCGHVCTRACHPYDPEHKKYKCHKKCQKILCDAGHKCPFLCYEECPENCMVRVEKIIPKCQHKQKVPCFQDPESFTCQEPCQGTLQCGHPCHSVCGEPCNARCMVEVTLTLKCGHSQDDACYYKTLNYGPDCRHPCEHQLKCGHACPGSCSECLQGRYHAPCSHKCERLLICSHKCEEPCTRNCPPCKKTCENCCVHSHCKKPCGLPCAKCTEPCAWQCPHYFCSKLCHEPCDRPPCIKPCSKILACGHPCIGLCGDKCPNKCRICDNEEVTDILFGTEDDPEAYFIQLEDCGHLIEYTAMDKYMGMDDTQQANEEDVAIKLKECPKCKTPIRRNLRYGCHINRSLAEIEMVKMKINGQSDVKERRETLQKELMDNLHLSSMFQQNEFMKIKETLERRYITVNNLWIVENQLDFLIRVAKLSRIQRKNMSDQDNEDVDDDYGFAEMMEEFVRRLHQRGQKFTEQQVLDLQRELCRLTLLTELNVRSQRASQKGDRAKIDPEIRQTGQILEKAGQFSEQDEETVKALIKAIDQKVPVSGLGISDNERKMIVSALQMPSGHWHKCPNGHVYLITECGGAMESRRCPDCDATIGGGSHRLAAGNQVASEMDGAQHPAWSEANNLENYEQFAQGPEWMA